MDVGIREVEVLKPKHSGMQSYRDEPRSVTSGYPAQGQQNSSSALMQRHCPSSNGDRDGSVGKRPGGDHGSGDICREANADEDRNIQ